MNLNKKILTLHNIKKSYGQGHRHRSVLKNINFEVYEGETIAIVGRSGSGKSTLLNLMSGIDQPDDGKIIIDGQVINQLSEYKRTCYRRKNLGFVFQFFNLIPTLTVLENIHLPLELNNILTVKNRQSVEQLLKFVQLSNHKNNYPDQLSGGEQQRIAILRAIAHQPKLLFADEPTGNLDIESGNTVIALLKSMVKDFNTTLILVTHSQEVTQIADRVFTMQDGTLHHQHD